MAGVHVALHGPDAAVHDYHTQSPGSFAAALAAIATAHAAARAVLCTTLLTRSNYRVLAALPRVLAAHRVAAWRVLVPLGDELPDAATEASDRLTPRLALAVPFALHALETARRAGVPAFIAGAPLCLLGPFATRALPSPPRAYAPQCARCPAQPRCPGVAPRYLARFAGDELTPRGDVLPTAEIPPVARDFAAV